MSTIITGGYGSRVTFSGMDILCSSFSASIKPVLIRSSAMYGGKKESAVGTPHGHDYREASLSLNFPVTRKILSAVLKKFNDRTYPFRVVCLMPGDKNGITFTRCIFESLTLSCSRDSLVEASCSLFTTADQLDSSAVGGMSSDNGDPSLVEYTMDWSKPSNNTNVIPYWMTRLKCSKHDYNALSWSFTVSQEVVKKSYCSGLSANTDMPPYPDRIFVGPMGVAGDVEYFVGNASTKYTTFNMDGGLNERMSLYIGETRFAEFGKVHVTSQAPTVDASLPYSVSCSFEAYSIVSLGD